MWQLFLMMIMVHGHHLSDEDEPILFYIAYTILHLIYPAPLGAGGVGSIPANSDALNVPSFRRWRFVMKLSPLLYIISAYTILSYIYYINYVQYVFNMRKIDSGKCIYHKSVVFSRGRSGDARA
jgi:hypothetical protein